MVESYCNSEFYDEVYKGKAITAEALDDALLHASLSIAGACMYRIGDISKWPEFTQNQIRLATCVQADHDHKYGDMEEQLEVVGGYSIGDVSVSSKSGKKSSLEEHYKITRKAIQYLMPTGLLDRRLR